MTSTLVGVEALPVEVQVDVSSGLPTFSVVGLPDLAVQEARERVRAAIRSSGFEFPNARVVVNLAPSPLRKHGTGFDLPIALGVLAATMQAPLGLVESVSAVGELTLAGCVRTVPGMLAHAIAARDAGRTLLGPPEAMGPASLSGARHRPLSRLVDLDRDDSEAPTVLPAPPWIPQPDLSEVAGNAMGRRALEIAAAGGHNLLMVGPPGSGKTMLARRLPSILPPLDDEERLEAALVHSVAGLDETAVIAGARPFRAPHHSATVAGLLGGGSPTRPGEASLAHTGVLFLDEMPEFGPATLQSLRQPLEDGHVTLVRAEGRVRLPARFALVGAANPCPCGYLGDPERACTCSDAVISKYASRIGGPLMDRMDLCVRVDRVDPAVLLTQGGGESSAIVRDRVLAARERARADGRDLSGRLSGTPLRHACALTTAAKREIESVARVRHLSARSIARLLRVSRTIADLDGCDRVDLDQVLEAVAFRTELFA